MTTYVYQIRDWEQHFETSRSKDLDYCRYIQVPNKQHGMGFTRIMAQLDGAGIFGIWYLILGACSQQRAPRRGWLTDDGRSDGRAWTIADMAERWRRTEVEIGRALDVLCSPRIAWIEAVDTMALKAPMASISEIVENSDAHPEGSNGRVESSGSEGSPSVDMVLGDNAGEFRGDYDQIPREGRGEERTEGREATLAPPAVDQLKAENRELIRATLNRLRMGYSDKALDEWRGWLEDAGCRTVQQAIDCLTWLKRMGRKDGKRVDYARFADGYEVAWRELGREGRARAAKLNAEAGAGTAA